MEDDPNKRTSDGRFAPGNRLGTGRARISEEVKEMLRCATPKAARAIIDALDAEKTVVTDKGQTFTYTDHEMRLKAANALFDRLYGKPSQAITGEEGGPVKVDFAGLVDKLRSLEKSEDE